MEKIKELNENLSAMMCYIGDLDKHAEEIHEAYETVNIKYQSIEEKLTEAEKAIKKSIDATDILVKNINKLDDVINGDFSSFFNLSSGIEEILSSFDSLSKTDMPQFTSKLPLLEKEFKKYTDEVKKRNDILVDLINTTSNQNNIPEIINDMAKNFSSLKELKNMSNGILGISKTVTKFDTKLGSVKDYIEKVAELSEEMSEEASIIKMMITDAKSEIIAAVAGQTSATELAVPRKSSRSKKKNERQIDKALGLLRGQFSYLNTDNDLEEAVEDFIGSAEEEVSSGAIRYVSEESNLNVVKDGRNGRRAWRGNYHTNINEIVIPLDDVDDQLEPNLNIVLLGKNIKNGKVDSIRSMKISELDDYALLSD